MPATFQTAAYLVAGVLFIRALGGLSQQETARAGNIQGIIGMAIAIAVTLLDPRVEAYVLIIGAFAVGGVLGVIAALRVGMTSMPQLVAILHSFVGLAAVLVGMSSYLNPGDIAPGAAHTIHLLEIYIGVPIGAITFTGSILAWLKLDGKVSGAPLLLPGRHFINLAMLAAIIGLGVPFMGAENAAAGMPFLIANAAIACVLGLHLVAAIGGADMPVVVSLLNSYSGWAAAAAGFMLSNDLLIITGALVGSSGAILSYIMCEAMNRSIWNVVFGGFGTAGGKVVAPAEGDEDREIHPTEAPFVGDLLGDAGRVIIVPGYGMAVAQAQHLLSELTRDLREAGVSVKYAIHPVAGRLPGHMNVLLAEASIPYDIVFEMEDINEEFPDTDVVLVIGANDIVNPGAQTDANSPIYGMPVLEVWKASNVVVFKRGMAAGYAGVGNPLFFHDNTLMLFGDAHDSVKKLVEHRH